MAQEEETTRILTLEFPMTKIKGTLAFHMSKSALGPDGKHSYTEMKLILPLDYQDWLFLEHSADAGYMVTITPIMQPLPMDDENQCQLPIDPDGPAEATDAH